MLQLFLVSVKENDYSIHFCYESTNIMKILILKKILDTIYIQMVCFKCKNGVFGDTEIEKTQISLPRKSDEDTNKIVPNTSG